MLPIDNTAVEILLLLWMLAFGGAIGSFLNVVVYRTPRGRSIVHPGSQCPNCGHAIRSMDNVPVLAWLWLRGRCRDCQAKISARYPIVEFITAVLFASLGWVEVFQNGGTVAAVDLKTYLPWPFAWKCGLWAFHMLLLCTLLSAGLIRFDGLRVPRAIWYLAAAVGLVAPVVWPWLLPGIGSASDSQARFGPLIFQVVATVAAAAIVLAVAWLMRGRPERNFISQTIDSPLAMLIVISLFLGIQAGTCITLASLVLSAAGTRLAGRLLPAELLSVGVSWGWIVCWPWLCNTLPVLGPGGDFKYVMLVFGGMAVAIGVLTAWTRDPQKSQPI